MAGTYRRRRRFVLSRNQDRYLAILQLHDYDRDRWLAGEDAEALAAPFSTQLMAMADA